MRLPNAAHESRPWRIREIAPDFTVQDVWALPVRGGAEDFQTLLELTSRCAIAFGTSLPGVFGWLPGGGGLAGCGAVGYQGADRGDGLGQVFAPAGPALQGPPVLAVGDGVFDADPCR